MAHISKTESGISKDKNLILVSNNSNNFQDYDLGMMLSRNSSHPLPQYRRNSSNNNLFSGFTQETKPKQEQFKKEEHLSDAQKYAQECLEYEKYMFDQKIRLIIHRMAILAYHNFKQKADHPFLTFFIQRFLCTLSKKLLLNRFQLLFLEFVFEESKWRYDHEIISHGVNQFKPLMHIPESQNPHGMVKNLQVYLLFCAFYSKRSLNDIANQGISNFFLKSIHEQFKERYQAWAEGSGISRIKVQPKILNAIFRKLNSFQEREKDITQNYNLLVEEILEISPAYNADKDNKEKRKKKKKVEEEEEEEKYQREQDSYNPAPEIQPILHNQESSEGYPSLRKKPTSYIENLNGLDPVAYYNKRNNG